MNRDEIIIRLTEQYDMDNILIDECLCSHVNFKVGGPADIYVRPQNKEQLIHALRVCNEHDIPFFILGNGSNLLVNDNGFRGMVIHICRTMNQIDIIDYEVNVDAGALLSVLANNIANAGLTGFEFAAGIPGTIGGAVYMNAGAYEKEIKDVIETVEVIDKEGNELILNREQMEFGYRSSILQKEQYIVTRVNLRLQKGNKEDIVLKIKELNSRRREKQPLNMPSAGSTFKRPQGNYAGKLIQDSELKGFTLGGAMVSEKHAGFIVNKDNATAKEIIELIDYVINVVRQKFGVTLEPEVRILGEYGLERL